MKLERSKNAIRNIKASFISKIVSLICPFIVRTVFIKTLGAEFLGVNSLFTSILSVLSLTELGFGSAIVFNMYKAIADDDDSTINALLYFYRKVYRYVGCIILAIGLILIPFLPYLVNGSYPDTINAIVVYLIFLGNTVISYFMYAYLQSLLSAFQRDDVITVIGMYMNIAMYALQIVLLVTVKNYYAYLAITPVFTVLSNIRTAIVAHKMFPQYKPMGKLSKEIKLDIREKVGGLLVQKICGVSRNAFDSIFVSMFLGLTQIAIYNNYYYIMNSITMFMAIITSAIVSGAGNSVASDSKEKNHQDMMRLNFIYMWIGGWCTICLFCLYQNFMQLWVGNDLMLPLSSVVLFCLYFYVLRMGDIRGTYVQATGTWWQNRYRAIIEAIANIVLNYLLGKYFGVNGIIAATLISLFIINFCFGSQIIYRYYFTEQKMSSYFLTHGFYLLVTVFIGLIVYFMCLFLPSTIIGFGIKIIICAILPNIIYLLIYRKTKIYKEAMPWTLSRIGIKENSKIWKLLVE
jgi:O-antigen/teichoic acid export membrane protein